MELTRTLPGGPICIGEMLAWSHIKQQLIKSFTIIFLEGTQELLIELGTEDQLDVMFCYGYRSISISISVTYLCLRLLLHDKFNPA